MKYSPQQRQQQQQEQENCDKTRKSVSEMNSTNVTPSRRDLTVHDSTMDNNKKLSTTRRFNCRPGMFAWMRVFRFATILQQLEC